MLAVHGVPKSRKELDTTELTHTHYWLLGFPGGNSSKEPVYQLL